MRVLFIFLVIAQLYAFLSNLIFRAKVVLKRVAYFFYLRILNIFDLMFIDFLLINEIH